MKTEQQRDIDRTLALCVAVGCFFGIAVVWSVLIAIDIGWLR
jgi:hypothetical protein